MRVIASYNLKGGVGKTTAAVNLAYLSAAQGHRTLLWDLDPQGAATYLFRVRPRVKGGSPKLVRGSRPMLDAVKATDFADLDLLPADFTYRHMDIDLNGRPKPQRTLRRLLSPLRHEYDYVFLDTPPSLSLVSENVIRASDLRPRAAHPHGLVGTHVRPARRLRQRPGRGQAGGAGLLLDARSPAHAAPRDPRAPFPTERSDMSTVAIPSASAVEQMAVRRAPLMAFAPRSPAALAFTSCGARSAVRWRQ